MTQEKSKRERMHVRRRNQQMRRYLIWGGLGLTTLAVIGLFVWQTARPRAGESVAIMQSGHIATDSDPGAYNSDPPTSGPHYDEEARAGFYDTNNYTHPAGHLVHNLEHGYVIFWYNCDKLSEDACTELKTHIKTVMDDLGSTKLIAYPWPSLDVSLAMTSWGRLEKFEAFDAGKAKAFVRANLNHAPEPNAP